MICTTEGWNLGKVRLLESVIDKSPTYQREGAVWSIDKKQLFIDSVFAEFDVPKLYLHDIRTDSSAALDYAIIDGKQRLETLWEFMRGDFTSARDFSIEDATQGELEGAVKFTELGTDWQDVFKSRQIDVVLVSDADEEDIEDLFSRLNNGEPLNAAEKRNAMGGKMVELIRTTSDHKFLVKNLKISNNRYAHREIAVKFLLIEHSERDGKGSYCDLKKRHLDNLVSSNKSLSTTDATGLTKRVDRNLSWMNKLFDKPDALLSKQAYPPLYYLFIKELRGKYGHPNLRTQIHGFLENFELLRVQNFQKPEDDRDNYLTEYSRLMQQGTNDLNSLEQRVSTLVRFFLQEHPEVELKDPRRAFSQEERFAVWIRSGKQCANCDKELPQLSDMQADHVTQWEFAGATKLSNGRALCATCNASLATTTS